MTSTPSTGNVAATVGAQRRPQLAAGVVALLGCGVGALVVGASTGRWLVSLVLVGIGLAVIALDLVRVALGTRLPVRLGAGLQIALAFDVFALGVLTGAWALAGGMPWLAGAMAALAVVVAGGACLFRRQILTAFLEPRSSPLGIVLALIPALAAVGGGGAIVLVHALPGPAAPAVVMAAAGLYVLLFTQAALLRVQVPGWQPPRPRSDTRSR